MLNCLVRLLGLVPPSLLFLRMGLSGTTASSLSPLSFALSLSLNGLFSPAVPAHKAIWISQ